MEPTMRLRNFLIIAAAAFMAMLLPSCGSEKKYRIGVSQCSVDDWRAKMNEEMLREAMLHDDAEVVIRSADDSNEKQIADIRWFADNGFDIIIAAPNEAEPVTPVIDEVMSRGIPVIVFDRNVTGDNYTAFRGADNHGTGLHAARYMLSHVGPDAKVLEITGNLGSTPAQDRRNGFMQGIAGSPGVKVVASASGLWDYDHAYATADSLLSIYPDVNVIYAHNDRMAIAAADAAARHGVDPYIIGIDAAPEIGMKAVADGKIDATFIYPTEGDALIRTALDILEHRPFERVERVPVASAVDRSNADILILQNKSLQAETSKIKTLKSKVDAYWEKHSIQTTFLYVTLGILLLLFVFMFLFLRAYWQKQRQQRLLVEQNHELQRQRDREVQLNQALQVEKDKQIELNQKLKVEKDKQVDLNQKLQVEKDKQIELNQKLKVEKDKQVELNQKLKVEKDKQVELNQELQEATQSKLMFFTNVSHDLRTPLTLIAEPVRRLMGAPNLTPQQTSLISIADRNLRILHRLINQILDFRKYENGKSTLHLTEAPIITLLSDWTEAFRAVARIRHIRLTLQPPTPAPAPPSPESGLPASTSPESSPESFSSGERAQLDLSIAIDIDKIERVFFNLLSNAFKHTPDNGSITVTTLLAPDSLTISVADTGCGIPAEDLPNIFGRFFQVDKVHPNGSGIGLSVAKAFVELHGGTIAATSEPGHGSTFTVTLPLRHIAALPDPAAASTITPADVTAELTPTELPSTPPLSPTPPSALSSPSATASPAFPSSSPTQDPGRAWPAGCGATTVAHCVPAPEAPDPTDLPLLLAIDDNADILALLTSLLDSDYRIITAADGAEGIRKAAKYIPDLIICDVMMPVMDGLECCRRIKGEVSTSHIPVLMLTACSMDEQRVSGYESGADGYLSKPFSTEVLRARCASLIANRRRIKAIWTASPSSSSPKSGSSGENLQVFTSPPTSLSRIDSDFYNRFLSIFRERIGDPDINVDALAAEMGLGRSQFYRKIKALTNYSPVELIRLLRLREARHLLLTTERTISEIAYSTGFSTPAYFTRCYREEYAETPTATRQSLTS